MAFQWDDRKNAANLRKHGISFEIVEVFDWDNADIDDDKDHFGEDRYVAYGYASDGFGYVVAFTYRNEDYRIISVRRFSRSDYALHPPAALR
jgi:uncharacterized DUF497 family protein